MIYFAEAVGEGIVKIGQSVDPFERLKAVRCQYQIDPRFLALGPGGYGEEQAEHARFRPYSVGGEWFKLHSPLKARIDELRRQYPMHDTLIHDSWVWLEGLEKHRGRVTPYLPKPPTASTALWNGDQRVLFGGISEPIVPKSVEDRMPTEEELNELLERHRGNVAAIGRLFGKERMQVHRWMKRYGIDPDSYR